MARSSWYTANLMLGILLLFFSVSSATPAGEASKRDAAMENNPTYANVHYGDGARNVMDVWLAKSDKPTPGVMIIHGGGWLQGDKSKYLVGLKDFLDNGISVASINYRYLKQTIVDSGSTRGTGPVRERGDYPEPPVKTPLMDAARALQYLRYHAAEWNINPRLVALTGGSAGACTSLWLTFHDDLAQPNAADPVLRQSTKPYCTATNVAQTTLDPVQILEWIPNATYGGHAFGFVWDKSDPTVEIRSFLAHRTDVLAWIKEYSPYELVTRDDPPVYLYYTDTPGKGTEPKDPTHAATYGALLAQKLDQIGLPYEFVHPGVSNPKHKDIPAYLIATLKAAQ